VFLVQTFLVPQGRNLIGSAWISCSALDLSPEVTSGVTSHRQLTSGRAVEVIAKERA